MKTDYFMVANVYGCRQGVNIQFCVPIHIYEHKHILLCVYMCNHIHIHSNSLDIYVDIFTPKCKRRAHILVYRHTHIETLCVCTSIYKHKHELCANIRKYIHSHMWTLCIYTETYPHTHVNSKYRNTNMNSVRIYGNTHIPTCELRVSIRKYTHAHTWTVNIETLAWTLCKYTEIHTYAHVNPVYLYGNTHTHTRELYVYIRTCIYPHTTSVSIYVNTYTHTCELCVHTRKYTHIHT